MRIWGHEREHKYAGTEQHKQQQSGQQTEYTRNGTDNKKRHAQTRLIWNVKKNLAKLQSKKGRKNNICISICVCPYLGNILRI